MSIHHEQLWIVEKGDGLLTALGSGEILLLSAAVGKVLVRLITDAGKEEREGRVGIREGLDTLGGGWCASERERRHHVPAIAETQLGASFGLAIAEIPIVRAFARVIRIFAARLSVSHLGREAVTHGGRRCGA